ncbi:unnamed protein product [Vicia faba]|uniref:Uncharacterized protein n=1 Tax=Vicia faba TaxID=3906 RepID=A0AAV0Z983_VICFA|nr:unnamed protein product [Vicia faba]
MAYAFYNKQGFREDKGLTIENLFNDQHNHELLDEEYHGMPASHRKMKYSDIMQINDMLKFCIRPSQFYGSFANQSEGCEKEGFVGRIYIIRLESNNFCNDVMVKMLYTIFMD